MKGSEKPELVFKIFEYFSIIGHAPLQIIKDQSKKIRALNSTNFSLTAYSLKCKKYSASQRTTIEHESWFEIFDTLLTVPYEYSFITIRYNAQSLNCHRYSNTPAKFIITSPPIYFPITTTHDPPIHW